MQEGNVTSYLQLVFLYFSFNTAHFNYLDDVDSVELAFISSSYYKIMISIIKQLFFYDRP